MFRGADFPACASLVRLARDGRPPSAEIVPSLWHRLHAAGELQGGVVAQPTPSGPESILAFGLSVFLRDSFVDAFLASPRPHLAALVYECMLDGRSPVVPAREIPARNAAGGLHLAILHFGLEPVADDLARPIIGIAQSGFRVSHLGYHVRTVLQEACGVGQLPFFYAGGFVLKSDYANYYEALGLEPPVNGTRPYLMGLAREDPESRYPGKAITDLFQHTAPRFLFSRSEQRVLQHAVMDESDEAIAAALDVSLDAVKKAWRRIFERVAAVDPGLLGPGGDVDRRGKEKRRPLIQYVRYHLEELRPFRAERAGPS